MSEILEHASFDAIRYAQVWEDADVLTSALDIKEEGTYLSIASAGDNALALLSKNPKAVVALDLNQTQLFLLELKVAAFKTLSYSEVLEFLGVKESSKRLAYYQSLSLSPECQNYFDNNVALIKAGVNHSGKFENYFKMFRTKVMPWIHSEKTITQLLTPRDLVARQSFYQKTWNSWKWRVMFKLFFSKTFMGYKGRDKAFFNYVEGSISEVILAHTKYALTTLEPAKNPYLHYILKGNFDKHLPLYLREENFEMIKNNLHKLQWHHQSIEEYLQTHSENFDGFNLSDIFEYMSPQAYERLLQTLLERANKNARLVYWNMMVKRSRPESLAKKLSPLKKKAEKLYARDQTFFYRDFIIEEVL